MPCSLGWAWAGTGSFGGWSSAQKLLQITWQMPPAVVDIGLLCFGVSETPSSLPSAASSSVQGACLPGGGALRRCPGLGPNALPSLHLPGSPRTASSCWGLCLAFPPPATATPSAPGLCLQSHRESGSSSHPRTSATASHPTPGHRSSCLLASPCSASRPFLRQLTEWCC